VVGVAICADKCGDGIIKHSPCDDGNTKDGDGCSSSCEIEANFSCRLANNGSSLCYFIGNITLEVAGIYKHQFANKVDIYIQVTPYLPIMNYFAHPNFISTNGSTFTDVSLTTYIDPDEPDIVNFIYTATYSVPIEDTFIRIELKPSLIAYSANPYIFNEMPPTNITVPCKSSNAYLL
jgi:cysteine-rich repeat protein